MKLGFTLQCIAGFLCRYKTWTLDYGLHYGQGYGLDYGLDFGLYFGLDISTYKLTFSFLVLPTVQFLITSSLVLRVEIIQIPMRVSG